MSIYSPNDSLWVMKTGDTRTGDLNMRGNLVRGLPTDPPVDYQGDEAVSWAQTVRLVQDASSEGTAQPGVTAQPIKLIIAIWAEEKGALSAGAYEFSFGYRAAGYPMLVPGRFIRMGLNTVP